MNKQQRAYAAAERGLKSAEATMAAAEAAFLERKGRPERNLCEIEDDRAFDALLTEFYEDPEIVAMEEDVEAKRAVKKAAEQDLIEYALEISPAGIRETLRRGAERQIQIRRKLIAIVMTLDTNTVR